MLVGTVSLPDNFKDQPFSWFKKYYDKVLKGVVDETAEEAYVLIGGELPKKKGENKKPSE